jgi:predicted methyltransferase
VKPYHSHCILLLTGMLCLSVCWHASAQTEPLTLDEIINSELRDETAKQRDQYRHPQQTLEFFGIKPDMAVLELWPGDGWYTEILAPYLRAEGHLIAAHFNPDTKHEYALFFKSSLDAYNTKLELNPDWFDRVEVVAFEPPVTPLPATPGSLDLVISFLNIHNWLADDTFTEVLRQVRLMLKSNGTLGIVDHRAAVSQLIDPRASNGYVNQEWLIQRIVSAGFILVAKSPINSNLNDTGNHPNGVWTLPPTLRVPEGEDKQKYLEIGESDRFTLLFTKK